MESVFGQESVLLSLHPVAGIQNKVNFPFHQPGLFILAFEWQVAKLEFDNTTATTSNKSILLISYLSLILSKQNS